MFIFSFCSKLLMWILVSFSSLLVPCTFFFISLFIAFTSSSILWPYSTIYVSILTTSVLNFASDRLAVSSSFRSVFGALICSFIWAIFFCLRIPVSSKGQALGVQQGRATNFTELWLYMWGRGQRKYNATCSALHGFSVTSPATHKQIGPFWCWFLGGWACVHSRNLWVSPVNSPVRLGVSPTVATSSDFYSQRFWDFISICWNPGLCGLSCSPVVPPGLSSHKCGTAWSASHCLATCPLWRGSPPPPLLPVWMNISSLTPWLSELHTVQFSGSSSYCLFLNLLSFFWLWGGKVYLPTSPTWPQVPIFYTF